MDLIWYNPLTKSYQAGSRLDYQVQQSNCSEEVEILYELDELTRKLAGKIVNELNSARVEVRV